MDVLVELLPPVSQQLTPVSQQLTPSYYTYARGSAFDLSTFSKLSAFSAGPRRDPLSRQIHIQSIAEAGRGGLKRGPAWLPNTFGSGITVPPQWPYSWETDLEMHTQRRGVQPSRGARDVFSSGAAGAAHPNCGILGPEPRGSPHFARLSSGVTEEQKRMLILTNERHRRHAELKYAPTDTLGLRQQLVPLTPRAPPPQSVMPLHTRPVY